MREGLERDGAEVVGEPLEGEVCGFCGVAGGCAEGVWATPFAVGYVELVGSCGRFFYS